MTYSGYSSRAKGRFFSLPDSQYSSKGHNPRFSKLRQSGYGQQSSSNIPDDAILLLPGVNVRVHYQSTTTSERPSFKAHSASFSSVGSGGEFSDGQETSTTGSGSWRTGSKSAGLYAWLSVQPLPREMIVQPSLLDFLNKALEPIVIAYPNTDNNQESMSDSSSSTPESRGNGNESMVSSSSVDYSFPVNVVVCVRVQPSDVRFSCLPVSKVECLLRLPLLDLVISSSKNQNKQATQKFNLGSSPKKQKGQAAGARNRGTSPSRSEVIDTDIGGVSFTVCLSRFSFCIFHPYGKQYGSTSERSFVESGLFPGRRKARGIVPQPISGRKDSLSLNVEFIKFNLFRKRMKVALSNGGRGKRSSSSSDDNKTVVKVSALCDIGSAAFNYDMRRLNEILDVPKAWYKRDLYRRLFLGKEGAYATKSSVTPQTAHSSSTISSSISSNRQLSTRLSNRSCREEDLTPSLKRIKATPRRSASHRRTYSGSGFLGNIMATPTGLFLPRSATVGTRPDVQSRGSDITSPTPNKKTATLPRTPQTLNVFDEEDGLPADTSASKPAGEWETHVVLALNLSRMDVSTNMGNVMGQAIWSTTDLHAQSRLLINNTGTKTVNTQINVRQGSFDAHGGIIGGYIDVQNISAKGNFEENLGSLPVHLGSVGMRVAEVRLDYMGSCILMGTISGFNSNMHDTWVLPDITAQPRPASEEFEIINETYTFKVPDQDPGKNEIRIHGEAGWDELKIIMSRSTTPDFIKMLSKLEEFFNQQQRNSALALSGVRPLSTVGEAGLTRRPRLYSKDREDKHEVDGKDKHKDGLKYQHWVEILNCIPGIELNNLPCLFPDYNVLLGGSLALKANFISLACFYGSNFRAQNWGLFTIKEPFTQFKTEIQSVEKSCQIKRAICKQDFSLHLGHHGTSDGMEGLTTKHSGFMATIKKVTRGRRNPPSLGAPVQDWLAYVATTSDDDVLLEDGEPSSRTAGKQSSSSKRVSFAPKVRYENESEVVFGLPRLSLHLITEHDQPMTARIAKILALNRPPSRDPWLSTVPSPHVVDCTFESRFGGSLCVTMDVSALLFLHELIQAYMKEKDAVVSTPTARSYRGSRSSEQPADVPTDSTDNKNVNKVEATPKKEKYRQFRSKSWKLEPRIRLLSWAGKQMDPVNIDWVLEKLGFAHAALTIPKWVQRGVMDPMDMVLALLEAQLLASMQVGDEDANV